MFKPECNRLGPNPASDIPRPVILINQLIAVNLSFFVCIMRAFSSWVRALCPCHNLDILSRASVLLHYHLKMEFLLTPCKLYIQLKNHGCFKQNLKASENLGFIQAVSWVCQPLSPGRTFTGLCSSTSPLHVLGILHTSHLALMQQQIILILLARIQVQRG